MNIKFEEIAAKLLSCKDQYHGIGASQESLTRAEQRLGLKLVGGYYLFLRRFGWGGAGIIELYGVGHDVPKHLDLIEVTVSERTEMEPNLRNNLLPIMNDGGGNLYCLDTGKTVDGENQIVFWDHDLREDQTPEVISDNFAEWFFSKLDNSCVR